MLNIGKIEEGFVLDHIQAGKSMQIYKHLGLDKLDSTVAIIKNARSKVMGKKDILKIECDIDSLDLDVLAFIDHNITVNVIKDGQIRLVNIKNQDTFTKILDLIPEVVDKFKEKGHPSKVSDEEAKDIAFGE